ncbi:MAG: hypothetical protein ACM3YE_06140 [Bacteroidota bacterium]
MDYNDLLEKYHVVQREKNILKEEIKRLKLQLGIPEQLGIPFDFSEQKPMLEMIKADCKEVAIPNINHLSTPA